ncbi:uncharacterized protein CXQ87_003284 [Candidozyma duobushaemuli]|uniref:Uncharacterized protein n=1 Tax=Candidozyma duobushaemuli TaxID=1231522 RepID=A0A2V1AD37_9ASCO|nr:uncharacterized protein CXQ87_003284 [[Candida] duobushaemulonis]PVH15444.1 hypothetical protein CXQ87_003284 [[Candida] duobushaemulonis]
MRSLIKGHRRSDSSTSEPQGGYSDLNPKSHRYNKTPQASPKVPSNSSNMPHLTPPQYPYSGSQSTLSSPKKLLTPIKKMFGHHSSKHQAPSSGDILHSALASEGPPASKKSPTLHSPRSMSSLNDLSPRPHWASQPSSRSHISHVRHSSTSYLENSARFAPPNVSLPNGSFGLGRPFESSSSLESTVEEREKMPIISDNKLAPVADSVHHGDSDSNLSIAKSINFSAKQASSQENLADGSSKVATDDFYQDDSSEESDNSSQFSFVKDIRGGRNTSVKYYKTKSSKRQLPDGVKSNTFDVDDFGYEDDGLSDYDFENNGLDDEEEDDEFENKYMEFTEPEFEGGNLNKYEDMLDENDMRRALSPPPPIVPTTSCLQNSSSSLSEDIEVEDRKADMSDLYITANSSHNFMTSHPEDPTYGEDLLESYMEKTKSPSSEVQATPHQRQLSFSHIPAFSGSEISSPLINGVTFGFEGLKGRQNVVAGRTIPEVPRSMGLGIGASAEDEPEIPKRNSIMDLLGALEGGDLPSESNQTPAQARNSIQDIQHLLADLESRNEEQPKEKETRRASVVNMMDTLANLAKTHEAAPAEEKKEFRRSVAEMMNTLAALDLQNGISATKECDERGSEPVVMPTPTKEKRHDSPRSNSYLEDNSTESGHQYHLDEDMLYECNQLPEDYDFEHHQNQLYAESVSEFYRSNSYNKKPKKMVQENSLRSNKIDTPQRTVTFYRSNSLGNSDNSNSGSLSRTGTVYSATSFTSGEEDPSPEMERFRQKSLPYALNTNFQLNEKSSDCLSHKSFNLEPITEGDSPHVK